MTTRTIPQASLGARLVLLVKSRQCGLAASAVFVLGGMGYFFVWFSAVHHGKFWNTPGDIWLTFQVAGRVVHGHVGTIYVRDPDNFLTFPGIIFVLSPMAALTSALHLTADVAPNHIVAQPSAWLLLAPYILLLSTVPLLACDALAERLGVAVPRRLLLGAGGVVALWGVTVVWGHPEDAMAVGFSLYALLFVIDKRWHGAAWLFGVAVALQPLVLVTLPLVLVLATWNEAPGLLVRAAVPSVAVLAGPLVANFHLTAKTLFQQPGYPNADHATPWTALAPHLFGKGLGSAVAAGPGRLVLIIVACGVAWWAKRWRDRPEMLIWAFALFLALRPLTESVMLPYYLYPALAVGMLAASRAASWRFLLAIALSAFVTVSSQWRLGWASWWFLNLSAMVAVVALGANPKAPLHRAATIRAPRSKVESKFHTDRGRGVARRKQQRSQRPRKR